MPAMQPKKPPRQKCPTPNASKRRELLSVKGASEAWRVGATAATTRQPVLKILSFQMSDVELRITDLLHSSPLSLLDPGQSLKGLLVWDSYVAGPSVESQGYISQVAQSEP